MKHLCYLAGAMSCYYKENNYEKATKWREKAEEYFNNYSGTIQCINPVRFYSFDGNDYTNIAEPMRFDLRKVKESRVVLVNLEDLHLENEKSIDKVHDWKVCQIDRIEVGEYSQDKAMEYIKNYYG